MAVFALCFVVILAWAPLSSAMYCLCKDGVNESQLQKNIDFACGSGGDCSAILQNGVCFNPNTVKDHCNYAVNSYYQRQSPSGADCSFSGTAALSGNPPASVAGSCVYQSTAGGGNGQPTPPGFNGNAPPFGIAPGSGTPDSAVTLLHKHNIFLTISFVFSSLICLRF